MASLPQFTGERPDLVNYPHAPDLKATRLGLGCMHFGGTWDPGTDISTESRKAARAAVETALELGWNFFDHADIYCRGRSEVLFAEVVKEMGLSRESMILQSKCGICIPEDPPPGLPRWYDFSGSHILSSVDGILKRLETDYLDILLLHRPDLLADPEEVMTALGKLKDSGKVRHFGVSNFTPPLLDLYKDAGLIPAASQVEINLLKSSLIDAQLVSEGKDPAPGHPADGTLEWHRRHGVVTQAWAPMAYGYLSGRNPDKDDQRTLNAAKVVADVAAAHDVPAEAVVIAWLLRHPAGIQPIIGTRNPERLRACHKALKVQLDRKEWYRLYHAGRGTSIP